MSKDKIEVSMNVYDIPIVVEALEEANKEIERLHSIIKEVREKIKNTKFAFDFDKEIKKLAFDLTYTKEGQELLEILDKENK